MSDITALAKTLRLAAESEIAHRAESDTSDLWQDEASPENILALVEALEKAQQERENWRTSFDNERFRADKLKAHIDDIEPIRAAAEKLVRCKGRYHSEQNYRALAALFGVNTPDLPPLEHENVHYADTAEMEIAALRQRIAELESRTVTVKLPTGYAIRPGHPINEGERGVMIPKDGGTWLSRFDVKHALQVAGIQVIEGEGQ